MANYAIIDTNSNQVVNVVLWDGITPFNPPDEHILVECPSNVCPGFSYENDEYSPPESPEIPENIPDPLPITTAMGELTVNDFEVGGVETSVGIGAAIAIDVNIFWIFFSSTEVDTSYLAFVQSPGCNADVTDRQADYFEITVTDRATNSPISPTSLSISVQRVK